MRTKGQTCDFQWGRDVGGHGGVRGTIPIQTLVKTSAGGTRLVCCLGSSKSRDEETQREEKINLEVSHPRCEHPPTPTPGRPHMQQLRKEQDKLLGASRHIPQRPSITGHSRITKGAE